MKTFKTLTACAIALFCIASVHAQTQVYITGSTAFRSAATVAIKNIYDASPAVQVAFSNNSGAPTGANQVIYVGNIGGVATNIHTSWSGSEAGIQTVADATQLVNFLPDSTCPGSCSAYPGTSVAAGTDAHHPDAAFSDTFQSTSLFRGSVGGVTYANLIEAQGTSAGHGSPVGVVVFKWCASSNATFTNMTSQLARLLYKSGEASLAQFTGNNADESKPVVAMGRNPDSGTRLTTFAEAGLGALSGAAQYQPQDSTGAVVKSTTGTISQFSPWPDDTVNGIVYASPDSGYSSGGDLSKAMRAVTTDPVAINGDPNSPFTAANVTRVAYLGTGDADSNLLNAGSPPPGIELKYNGVSLGVFADYNSATVLLEGLYTFWSYEHILFNNSTINSTVKGVVNTLATRIHDVDATGNAVSLGNMKVKRSTDGATVVNIYATP
jgi:hypothetical protein